MTQALNFCFANKFALHYEGSIVVETSLVLNYFPVTEDSVRKYPVPFPPVYCSSVHIQKKNLIDGIYDEICDLIYRK